MLLTQTDIAPIYHGEVVKVSSLILALPKEVAKLNSYGVVCINLVVKV